MNELNWKSVKAVQLADLAAEQADRIAQTITSQYSTWKQQRRSIEDLWQEIDRQVNQFDPVYSLQEQGDIATQFKTPTRFGSKIKMTDTYAHREGLVAAIIQYLMQNDYDFFDVVPLDGLDSDKTSAVKDYLMWVLDSMNFEQDFVPFLRDLVQYGTAIASLEWCRETYPRWRKIQALSEGGPEVVFQEYQEVRYDAPKFTPLNLLYTVIDPTARDVRTATLIFQKPVPKEEIMANPAYTVTWEAVNAAPSFASNTESNREQIKEETRRNYQFSMSEYGDKVQVYEAWGDFVDGQTVYKNYVAEVMNNKLIRFEPNPYSMSSKPFVIARYTTETNRIYGHTPLSSITGIQAAKDTVLNQYIDGWSMENNRPWELVTQNLVSFAKNGKKTLPPMSADTVIHVRQPGTLRRAEGSSKLTHQDPTAIMAHLEMQMVRATGDSELTSGGNASEYMKTGVAMQVANAGNTRLNLYAKTIEKEAITPVLEMLVDLLRQMNTEPRTFRRKDNPNEEYVFDPTYLMNDIKFTMRGASYNITKQVQANALLQTLTMAAQQPMLQQILNWPEALKVVFENQGVRNISRLILPQAQAMMQQVNMQQPTFADKIKGFFGQQALKEGANAQPDTSAVGGSTVSQVGGEGQVSPFAPVQ
jgi:hypothetical protein